MTGRPPPERARAGPGREVTEVPAGSPQVSLVEWEATARRLGRSALALGVLAGLGWVVVSVLQGSWRIVVLGNLVGLALALMFLVEVIVVGGSALRGMLRAGERGERLAGDDVGLLPPARSRRRDP